MANMLEGGGKTPILPPEELQAMGFKLVAYPPRRCCLARTCCPSLFASASYMLCYLHEDANDWHHLIVC
jgi:hypothetical protein